MMLFGRVWRAARPWGKNKLLFGCSVEPMSPAGPLGQYVPAVVQAFACEEERLNTCIECYISSVEEKAGAYTSLKENRSMNSSVMTTKGWVAPCQGTVTMSCIAAASA
jgi:hypothetical protein